MKQLQILLIIFITIGFAQSISAQRNIKIGYIRGEYNIGCGDQVWLATNKKKNQDKEVIFNSCDSEGLINLNGRDLELKRAGGYLDDKNFKVGRGGYEVWKGKNITVRLNYIFTWLCPPKDEQCEVYYYKGILDINYNGKYRKVNIVGFGGS
ncbi:hypothetical protein BH10ACI1_BH10ACI1_04900 [soil metagenome]